MTRLLGATAFTLLRTPQDIEDADEVARALGYKTHSMMVRHLVRQALLSLPSYQHLAQPDEDDDEDDEPESITQEELDDLNGELIREQDNPFEDHDEEEEPAELPEDDDDEDPSDFIEFAQEEPPRAELPSEEPSPEEVARQILEVYDEEAMECAFSRTIDAELVARLLVLVRAWVPEAEVSAFEKVLAGNPYREVCLDACMWSSLLSRYLPQLDAPF